MNLENEAKENIKSLVNVSRETFDKLELYAEILEKWNKRMNLVSKSSLYNKWSRHFLDSAQLWSFVPQKAKTWVDIGSGAGFPGLVIAIIASELKPSLQFSLIESDIRKCSFLRSVIREINLNVDVYTDRIENMNNIHFDVVSARALASIKELLIYSSNILAKNGTCLFLKGKSYANELNDATRSFSFDVDVIKSISSAEGRIIKITGNFHD